MTSIEGNNVNERRQSNDSISRPRGAGLDGRVGLHRLPTLDFGVRGHLKLKGVSAEGESNSETTRHHCGRGGIGRRAWLRAMFPKGVEVRILSPALNT